MDYRQYHQISKLGFVEPAKSREISGCILNAAIRWNPSGNILFLFLLKQKLVANKRNDYLHKISTEIIKNHNLVKEISEVSWSQLRTVFEYKAKWYGKTVIAVMKNFPLSQLCSSCGYRITSMGVFSM